MLLAPFQNLLNRNIEGSSIARTMCRRLQGKVLALKFEGIPINIFLRAEGEQMILSSQSAVVANATLTGTPLAFMRLIGPQPENALRGGSVHITGDAETAQNFSELLRLAGPDLEEELSRLVGDVPAHQLGQAARSVFGFARRAADTFAQNVSEFLQEESRDAPSRTEADEFATGVESLRDAVDRVEARIGLLERNNNK
jgi:ubiquinone biosynthesis accessory factor UbiJ